MSDRTKTKVKHIVLAFVFSSSLFVGINLAEIVYKTAYELAPVIKDWLRSGLIYILIAIFVYLFLRYGSE